ITTFMVVTPSESAARNPFPQQRIHDDVAISLACDDIITHKGSQGGLNRGGSAEAMACPRVARQQLAPLLEDHGAKHRTLREGAALPEALEHHLMLGEKSSEGLMKVIQRGAAP